MLLSLLRSACAPSFPACRIPSNVRLETIESVDLGRHRICAPRPGVELNMPYDCQPLISQYSILSFCVGKVWMRTPLKNHGVFEETYDGWYDQLSKL